MTDGFDKATRVHRLSIRQQQVEPYRATQSTAAVLEVNEWPLRGEAAGWRRLIETNWTTGE